MKINLKTKYLFFILFPIIFMLILLAGFLMIGFRSTLIQVTSSGTEIMETDLLKQLEKRATLMASFVSKELSNPLYQYNMETIGQIASAVREQNDVNHVYIYDKEGRIIHDGTIDNALLETTLEDETGRKTLASGRLTSRISRDSLDISTPVKIQNELLGGVTIGFSLKEIKAEISEMKNNLSATGKAGLSRSMYYAMLMAFVFTICGGIIAIFLARRLARPISLLSKSAARIGEGDYDVHIPLKRDDEIGELAASFMKMADNLKKTTVSKEKFMESEERLRTLINAGPDIVCFKDGKGRWLEANEADLKLFGLEAVDYRGKKDSELAEFTHPVYRDAFFACENTDEKAWTKEKLTRSEETIPLTDGRARIFDVIKVPLFDRDGARNGLVVLGRDITERKMAEDALALRERYLSTISRITSLLMESDNPYPVFDRVVGMLRDASKACRCYMFENHVDSQGRLLTTQRFEACADGITPQIDNPDLQNISYMESGFDRWQKTLSSGEPIAGRLAEFPEAERNFLFSQDILSILIIPLRVNGGFHGFIGFDSCRKERLWSEQEIILLQTAAHAISSAIERRQAAEALVNEKNRLAVTLRSIGDGVIATDIEGTVILLNKSAERLTGWTQEEAIGKPVCQVLQLFHEKTRKPCQNPVEQALQTGRMFALPGPIVLVTKDGTERIVCDSGAPIFDRESRIAGVVVVFQDITEKRKMEKEMLKVEKLEALGVLAGGIAHDFNNLLTAILGYLSLSKMFIKPEEQIFGMLSSAEKASERARALTQQLLTFSKGGAPIKELTSINETVNDSAKFVLMGSNVRGEFSIPDDLWPVEADTGQIGQVIQNLVINAVQAMPDGGTIRIKAENITLEPESHLPLEKGKYVKISIKDEGVGIPSEDLSSIFDPYFTTKEMGSGLGLAVVYSIVRNHHGHIEVESEQGAGSTFSIYLPASLKDITTEEETKPRLFTGKGHILVMDDEEIVRDMLGQMLTALGFKVQFASDGNQALKIYEDALGSDDPFDAVIMDLTIPGGMGGKEAIKKLLQMDTKAKAIVSSGYSGDPVMADFRKYGFSGVINKPYTIAKLSEVLGHILAEGKGDPPPKQIPFL